MVGFCAPITAADCLLVVSQLFSENSLNLVQEFPVSALLKEEYYRVSEPRIRGYNLDVQ